MTNGEKCKNASERRFAYEEDCRKSGKIIGEFSWLELEYEEELKPCPFCGREPVSMRVRAGLFFCGWKIGCFDCGLHAGIHKTRDEAVAKWNEMTERVNETC